MRWREARTLLHAVAGFLVNLLLEEAEYLALGQFAHDVLDAWVGIAAVADRIRNRRRIALVVRVRVGFGWRVALDAAQFGSHHIVERHRRQLIVVGVPSVHEVGIEVERRGAALRSLCGRRIIRFTWAPGRLV